MRDFDGLDTSCFKTFHTVCETLNFTEAAKRAAMTQSGVSQHIAKLEKQLGALLFHRVKKKVFITAAGKKLKEYIEKYLDEIQNLKEELSSQITNLNGLVRYAMPHSCLFAPHFSMMLKERNKCFPNVELSITLCPSEEVFEKLLQDEVHFGFVTKKVEHQSLKFIPFCFEEYVLVGKEKEIKNPISADMLKKYSFVGYSGVEVLFDCWIKHHIKGRHHLSWNNLRVVGEMNSIDGAIQMLNGGVGITVIPKHCILSDIENKNLTVYSNAASAKNQIYIVTHANTPLPKRVRMIINTFLTFYPDTKRV